MVFPGAGSLFAQQRASAALPEGFSTVTDAAQMADAIVKAAGKRANFAIAEARVPNALAVVYQGKRFILYNPDFINALTKVTGTRWAAVSVLAHEIGHHLYKSNTNGNSLQLATELEADEFSGYVLAKMGATLEESEIAIKMVASNRASLTHPGRDDRVNSIESGWLNGGGVASTTTGSTDLKTPDATTPANDMIAVVSFRSDSKVPYYVTKNLELVRAEGDDWLIIGRVSRSGSETYPYMIYDRSGYKLFIQRGGRIVNAEGVVVGDMKAAG